MTLTSSILISGAAAGIGKAKAQKFLAEGWRVGAYDIDRDGLTALRNKIAEDQRMRLVTGVLDVTDNDSWPRPVNRAHYQGNRVHWPVGLQTKLMIGASKLSPNWLTRLTNRWLTRA